MQETWVRSLIWEDPTYHGATKPMSHNYWACSLCSGAWELQPLNPPATAPKACVAWSPCSTTREATSMRNLRTTARESTLLTATREKLAQQRRSSTAQTNKYNY